MRIAAILAGLVIVAPAQPAAPASAPVVVELFTSEGCSSCPPADALLSSLAATQPNVVALGEHVDYWDQLGWHDRFSSASMTNRQQAYARVMNVDEVFTPQMVVDGRDQFVGSDAAAARRSIERAASAPHATVAIAVDGAAVTVTVTNLPPMSRGERADVVLAVTESRLQTAVKGGENGGRLLKHADVVRRLTVIGEARGPETTARGEVKPASDWQRDHLTVVAFVQERFSRHILGASARPLS